MADSRHRRTLPRTVKIASESQADVRRPVYEEPRAYLSSSSSSSLYLDISRTKPLRSVRSFFFAPSERRRVRKRKSTPRLTSSSSSSLNTDLAYGTGFIKIPKGRGIGRRRVEESERYRNERRPAERTDRISKGGRSTTDVEILAIGAGLAKLANDQRKSGSRGVGNERKSKSTIVTETRDLSRGSNSHHVEAGSARFTTGIEGLDEEGWESAYSDESESSVDSKLAFGDSAVMTGFFGSGKGKQRPTSRKSTVVNPSLVTEPVGFEDVHCNPTSGFGQQVQGSVFSTPQPSLHHVHPVSTVDPSRFEAARSSVISGAEPYISMRPDAIDLRQPQPITPVSHSVYEQTYPRRSDVQGNAKTSSAGHGKSLAEAALLSTAIGALSGGWEGRKHESKVSDARKDSRSDSKDGSKTDRKREKHDTHNDHDHDEHREKRRVKDKRKDDSRSSDIGRDKQMKKRREEPRGETREERRDRREKRREGRRSEINERLGESIDDPRHTQREVGAYDAGRPIDPFQFQVPQDSFPTPDIEKSPRIQGDQFLPHIVTVDRAPDFANMHSSLITQDREQYSNGKDYGMQNIHNAPYEKSATRDLAYYNAENIYDKVNHSTAPVDPIAFSTAVASEACRESRSEKRRDERRSEHGHHTDKTRDIRSSPGDFDDERIQDEADRAYREMTVARKIASQVIRSQAASPDHSIIDRYQEETEDPVIRIVTPPGMEDHKKKQSLYDAPNADFRPDYIIKDPRELLTFDVFLTAKGSTGYGLPEPKRDSDALGPRPYLNLVHPTPIPTPAPEEQDQGLEKSTKNKDRQQSRSEVTGGSPTSAKDSTICFSDLPSIKGVTWGRNETKHYEIESPSEHPNEVPTDSATHRQSRPPGKDSNDWSAVAADVTGAGAAATRIPNDPQGRPRGQESDFWEDSIEYGHQENFNLTSAIHDKDDLPAAGQHNCAPKDAPAHIPGAFDEDLDFAAVLAAGLQDTGFDPDIVINDPSYCKRESPPGPNVSSKYRPPIAETVLDFGSIIDPPDPRDLKHGYIIGEVAETPMESRTVSPPVEVSPKLSKKEQKKRDKAIRQQNSETIPVKESVTVEQTQQAQSYFDMPKLSKKEQKKREKAAQKQPSVGEESPFSAAIVDGAAIIDKPENQFDTPKKSKKHISQNEEIGGTTDREARAALPVENHTYVQNAEEDWDTKRSKKRSKRDSGRFEPSSHTVPSSEVGSELSRSGSKKSKDRSKRRSEQYADPTEVALPPITWTEIDQLDIDDAKQSKKSKESGIYNEPYGGDTRSIAPTSASHKEESRKSQRKSKSGSKDDFDVTSSVGSAPVGRDDEDAKKKGKEKRSSGLWGLLFTSKSEVGARDEGPISHQVDRKEFEDPRKKSKKSKRDSPAEGSEVYGAFSEPNNDLPESSSVTHDQRKSSGHYNRNEESRSDEDRLRQGDSLGTESFLDNADILGADVGLTGAAAITQPHHRSQATNASDIAQDMEEARPSLYHNEILDPEITERQFRPSIDPLYGDLLPLPPSVLTSPNLEPLDGLPDLPESRPETPEAQRFALRDKHVRSSRRSQDTPMKSPSFSAVPLKFMIGNRSTPASPVSVRSPPALSPGTPIVDSPAFYRRDVRQERPISWDSAKEYKPLYLVKSNKHASNVQRLPDEDMPALPPSTWSSKSSYDLKVGVLEIDEFTANGKDMTAEPLSEVSRLNMVEMPPPHAMREDSDQQTHISDISDALCLKKPIEENQFQDAQKDAEELPDTVNDDLSHKTSGQAASIGSQLLQPVSGDDQLPFDTSIIEQHQSPVDPVTKDQSQCLLRSSALEKYDCYDPNSFSALPEPSRHGNHGSSNVEEDHDNAFVVPSQPAIGPQTQPDEARALTIEVSERNESDGGHGSSNVEEDHDNAFVVHCKPAMDPQEPPDIFEASALTIEVSERNKFDGGRGSSNVEADHNNAFVVPTQPDIPDARALTTASFESNEFEEFAPIKSKAQKKGKGLSRSSTQDEVSLSRGSQAGGATREVQDVEPAHLIVEGDSKGDDDIVVSESIQQKVEKDIFEETAVFNSKKDKKKGKKKTKAAALLTDEPLGAPSAEMPKKEKQKHKSESSSPAALMASCVESPQERLIPEMTELVGLPVAKLVSITETPQIDEAEAVEDLHFEAVRKGKKGNKAKKDSRGDLVSEPSFLDQGSASVVVKEDETDMMIPSQGLVISPVSVDSETCGPLDVTPAGGATIQEVIIGQPSDDFTTCIIPTPSKKDKRKRQSTAMPSGAQTQAFSWPDDVLEADIVQSQPVIQDIANDNSLSHIASTVESSPENEFLRPSKKGKSGLRRFFAPPPLTMDASGSHEDHRKEDHTSVVPVSVPVTTATRAAITGAAKALELMKGPDSSAKSEMGSKEAESAPSEQELTKTGDRNESVDNRFSTHNRFDGPALCGDAEPKTHQNNKGQEDGGVTNAFWSPPDQEVVEFETVVVESAEREIIGDATDVETERKSITEPIPLEESEEIFQLELQREHQSSKKPDTNVLEPQRPEQQRQRLPGEYSTTPEMSEKSELEVARDNAVEEAQVLQPSSQSESEPSHEYARALFPPPETIVALPQPGSSGLVNAASIVEAPSVRSDGPERRLPGQDISADVSTMCTHSKYGHVSPALSVVDEESEGAQDRAASHADDSNRDSAFVTGSPCTPRSGLFSESREPIRDSAVHLGEGSPAMDVHSPESLVEVALANFEWPKINEEEKRTDLGQSPVSRKLNDQNSTGNLRSSDSPETIERSQSQSRPPVDRNTELYRIQTDCAIPSSRTKLYADDDREISPETTPSKHESLVEQRLRGTESLHQISSGERETLTRSMKDRYHILEPLKKPRAGQDRNLDSPIGAGLITPSNLSSAADRSSQDVRPDSAQSYRSLSNPSIGRLRTPETLNNQHPLQRPDSANSSRGSSGRSGTPPLRRTGRRISGDLRSLSQQTSKAELAKEAASLVALTSASIISANSTVDTPSTNPTANEGRVRAKDMADVYDGFGEGRVGSPRSPTRPHSMRRRQSMQVLDLEIKVEQLVAENRALSNAKSLAEQQLQVTKHAPAVLANRDAEIGNLKRTLEWMQKEVTRLAEVNDGLTSANVTLGAQQSERYGLLEAQYAEVMRELQKERDTNNQRSTHIAGTVEAQIQQAVLDKDREIAQLHLELENTKGKIRSMQHQILANKGDDSDFLTIRDEDYFDTACQQLCQHVQQWVLRFSKFSDMRACRLTREINNDKIIDRLDNAILDGSDVDTYLADRVKRRDVFMSMTMTMVWEFIFTRYLFGMDRDQRQKLKSLEKLLTEVGPPTAVHHWRATTLTLLSKRTAFAHQRDQDTLAVVNAILETLTEILPPPAHLEAQIESQLTRVMKSAVELSIEMRTQRAEYMMLPPLQPEYDANGDLASKVTFNAALMNERSGETGSNEGLEEQCATVRIVLFPLVVKRGDDRGVAGEEIVVCPAQVLVAGKGKGKEKSVSLVEGEDLEMEEGRSTVWDNRSKASLQSAMPSMMLEEGDDVI